MSIYYKYATDDPRLVVLSYVYDCVYWYTSEKLGNWFVDTRVKRLHENFLGRSYLFISNRIPQLKDHYISMDHIRYATSIVAKYLDTETIKENSNFHKTTLPHDNILTKEYASTRDSKLEVVSTPSTKDQVWGI